MTPVAPAPDELVPAVLAWGVPRLRDLPWRRTRDPWAVLVSEVMLQQTQAARVAPRWVAFLARFPTPARCAHAPLGDVLREWEGLGYPRRARDLHAAAATVVARHGGRLPSTLTDLMELSGIGPYTARAVRVFAFERDEAVVDTNIARVLARVAGERLTATRAQAMADSLVPMGSGWVWNQVLMDLGAAVCRPVPRCDDCPLRLDCAWAVRGRPDPDPASASAGVSRRQSPFEGSDRQARGRLLRAVARQPVRDPAGAMGLGDQPERAERLVAALTAEGLVARRGPDLVLP